MLAQEQSLEGVVNAGDANADEVYMMEEEDKFWLQRCACATLYNVQSLKVVREELCMMGLDNFKLKLMGDGDVLLEFERKEEMEFTLIEARSALEEFFE